VNRREQSLLPRRTLADRMRPYACYATLLLYGLLVQGVVRELEERVQKIGVFKVRGPLDVLWSMSGMLEVELCELRGKKRRMRRSGFVVHCGDWLTSAMWCIAKRCCVPSWIFYPP
jgi:hypothetical protein